MILSTIFSELSWVGAVEDCASTDWALVKSFSELAKEGNVFECFS